MNLYKEIYRIEQLPVFQNRMFRSTEDAQNCAKGDVILVQDLETGLIFNQAFQPELMEYDADYQNETAVSAQFCKHLEHVTEVIRSHFWGESLIEVGCGKGYFLENLKEIGFQITGFDPAYEGSNTSIIKKYFTPDIRLKADGIILRHVLEHVKDPVGFLFDICEANAGSGKIYIEVPCFDWICEHHTWFDICYEHVNYFRLADFSRMFDLVHEAGHMFDGQFLYVVADLATLKIPKKDSSVEINFPENFLYSVEYYATKIKSQKTDAVIWGGATKGVIFALLLERKGTKIDIVIDINPAKQGKYIAGTGLQINSPAQVINTIHDGTDLFVMNSNYLSEINEMTEHRFNLVSVEDNLNH
jgi:SAM-dependent methyltransferase